MAVAAIFFKNELAVSLGLFAPFVLLIAYAFCLSTVYTPAISLSLEGNNFGLLKTLPIKGETIMSAKIIFNLLIEVPVIIFTFPFAAIGLGLDLWTSLASFLAVISFAVLTSIFFAWLNLFFPRFDFKSEAEIVKQSMSAFIAVFAGFGIIALEGAILFGLIMIPIPLAFPILFLTIINGLLAFLIYWPMHKTASLRLQKIEA